MNTNEEDDKSNLVDCLVDKMYGKDNPMSDSDLDKMVNTLYTQFITGIKKTAGESNTKYFIDQITEERIKHNMRAIATVALSYVRSELKVLLKKMWGEAWTKK